MVSGRHDYAFYLRSFVHRGNMDVTFEEHGKRPAAVVDVNYFGKVGKPFAILFATSERD